MLMALDYIARELILGPQTRKVKKYLDEATCASAREDLGKLLASQLPGWRENERLQATFDKYCIEGRCQRRSAISNSETELLWQSFHFYAYHPFPRDLANGEVDIDAFKRAALLTLGRCDDLLGTRELEILWRNDASFFREAGIARLFRSIGISTTTARLKEYSLPDDPTVSDAMDVLAMVVPQFIHGGPSPEQLEIVARRLFSEEPAVTERSVGRKEVLALIGLLLRLRVKKEIWGSGGSFFNFGDIAEASSTDAEVVEALVNSLLDYKNEQPIASEQLLRVTDLMPNLHLRFYQLWAVLFQPLVTTAEKPSYQIPQSPPTNIVGAVLLFAPRLTTDHRFDQTVENAHLHSNPQDSSIVRLIQTISRPSSGYIVLFTGKIIATASTAVVGVYFPNPVNLTSTEEEEEKEKNQLGPNNPHLLFQLQPKFRILRWTKPHISNHDLIRADPDTLSLAEIATRKDPETHTLPYRIGGPSDTTGGLSIDPAKNRVTLASVNSQWYKDVSEEEEDNFVVVGNSNEWDVSMTNSRMDILPMTKCVGRELLQNPSTTAGENEGPFRVEGEALRKRIQGFGAQ